MSHLPCGLNKDVFFLRLILDSTLQGQLNCVADESTEKGQASSKDILVVPSLVFSLCSLLLFDCEHKLSISNGCELWD